MITCIDTVFTALANPTRRELLRLLYEEGQQPVQQLASHFAMRRPTISEHLKVLHDAGLVSEHKRGRMHYYRLETAPLQEVQKWLATYEQSWQDRFINLHIILADERHK